MSARTEVTLRVGAADRDFDVFACPRLSRDLRDHIGQALTGVMLLLEDRMATGEGRAKAKALVGQTIDDVRRLQR